MNIGELSWLLPPFNSHFAELINLTMTGKLGRRTIIPSPCRFFFLSSQQPLSLCALAANEIVAIATGRNREINLFLRTWRFYHCVPFCAKIVRLRRDNWSYAFCSKQFMLITEQRWLHLLQPLFAIKIWRISFEWYQKV